MILLSSALTCKTKEGAWYDLNFNRPNCLKQRGVQIVALLCILVLNFAADILLVVTPLVMLWKVKLPTKERRLILVLFGTNVVSLFSSIIFAVIWYLVADHGAKFIILASMFTLLQVSHPKIHSTTRKIIV
jgi:hypothetical protein